MARNRSPGATPGRVRNALLTAAVALATVAGGLASAATALPMPAAPTLPAASPVASPGAAPGRETLRVCADPDNLPLSSADGRVRGLSMDIAQLVADGLGRPLEPVWTVTVFGKRSLRTTLLAGQCDAFVGLPETTDFMGKRLIFSRPLFTMGYALVQPVGQGWHRLADLNGARVGVQFGTPPQSLLATRSEVTSVTFMTPGAAVEALARGEIAAAFVWGPTAGYLNQSALAGRFQVAPIAGTDLQWPVGIGFARQNVALRDAVDRVLDGLGEKIGRLASQYGLPTQAPVPFAATGRPRVVLAAATAEEPAAAPPPPSQVAMARIPSFDPDWTNPDIMEGRAIFNSTCAHCHGPNAEQAVAKINLRLLQRRYGDKMDEIFVHVVTNGRPSRGMPSWDGVLTTHDFAKIGAFLHTVQQDK